MSEVSPARMSTSTYQRRLQPCVHVNISEASPAHAYTLTEASSVSLYTSTYQRCLQAARTRQHIRGIARPRVHINISEASPEQLRVIWIQLTPYTQNGNFELYYTYPCSDIPYFDPAKSTPLLRKKH